jgi:hypothetical protein
LLPPQRIFFLRWCEELLIVAFALQIFTRAVHTHGVFRVLSVGFDAFNEEFREAVPAGNVWVTCMTKLTNLVKHCANWLALSALPCGGHVRGPPYAIGPLTFEQVQVVSTTKARPLPARDTVTSESGGEFCRDASEVRFCEERSES